MCSENLVEYGNPAMYGDMEAEEQLKKLFIQGAELNETAPKERRRPCVQCYVEDCRNGPKFFNFRGMISHYESRHQQFLQEHKKASTCPIVVTSSSHVMLIRCIKRWWAHIRTVCMCFLHLYGGCLMTCKLCAVYSFVIECCRMRRYSIMLIFCL